MAKSTSQPPAPDPEEIDESLIQLAEMLIGDHFFDPDEERVYKRKLSKKRTGGADSVVLAEKAIELSDGECALRIEALPTWTHFRVAISHPLFTAAVEGAWSFENQELSPAKVIGRTGDPETIEVAVELIMQELEGGDLDDEFAEFMEELDGDEEVPMIGDDPSEPPEATSLDRNRVKAIAKRIARKPDADISIEDHGWLEQTPQVLPGLVDLLVEAASAAKRDEGVIAAYQTLLTLQLEFVRYRQDRGWEWAGDMLEAFQQRLIALANETSIPREDWFKMCNALSEARVPVSDAVQTALADAGFRPDEAKGPPEQMSLAMRGMMDELARMVSSPFEVIGALQNAGAMLPSALRGFMATELALSPHQVLRDAVPVMLLDGDSTVRKGAAGALEQTALPETMSPDALRRAIVVRNWLPTADRGVLDTAIRKARIAGVEIGAWPAPVRDLEFHASTIDGSGAQSILSVSLTGKKGFFGGLLLRHGTGVVDTWADLELSRGKINKLLREAQMAAPMVRVDKTFVDTMVEHAIGCSVAHDAVPPALMLEAAEVLGGAEWKDRRLDVAAEAERLFETLSAEDRTPEGIEAGFARGMKWMTSDEVFSSWFEDGPQVQQALATLPRTDRIGMTARVMTDILPNKRAAWAERFLIMALWSQAAAEARQRARAPDLILVAHALAGDGPLGEIPIMAVIAMQTVRATLLGAW